MLKTRAAKQRTLIVRHRALPELRVRHSGYFGGRPDFIIMRYIDLQRAFPNFIIAVYQVAVFGTGLFNIIAAISLAFIDDFARVARSMTLSIREEQYIDAARTLGFSDVRILFVQC